MMFPGDELAQHQEFYAAQNCFWVGIRPDQATETPVWELFQSDAEPRF